MTESTAPFDPAGLPPTSWAVLGLLSFGEELSGYDLKKWADASLHFFYWSPSASQVYGELKRLEKHGYVTSRTVSQDDGVRGKRMYSITASGKEAAARWVSEAPVEPPVLKHGVMLRLWLGHMTEPEQLRDILEQHRAYAEKMTHRARATAEGSAKEPSWAYTELVLRWSEKYYEAEREFAESALRDLDEVAATVRAAEEPASGSGPRRRGKKTD
ncbi:PadR family transcriptional regulator [Streptomyces sp. NPDC053560]|uniref:PadR family transcriptional regulator n=1 Tax=Streptomyces sp. NPDC053560 TaxID=3365711 RepID=UPI0037D4FF05